jgi:hypothetical protein
MGLRTPEDVRTISPSDKAKLLAQRGWGPLLLDKILGEIEKVLRRQKHPPVAHEPEPRLDDAPLEGERTEHP